MAIIMRNSKVLFMVAICLAFTNQVAALAVTSAPQSTPTVPSISIPTAPPPPPTSTKGNGGSQPTDGPGGGGSGTTSSKIVPYFTVSLKTETITTGRQQVYTCTTTQSDWFDWKSAPTPVPYYSGCGTAKERGHELSQLQRDTFSNQEFFFDYNAGLDITACCELCTEMPNCAMYEVKQTVCGLYIVVSGDGTITDQCSAGIFEIEEGYPQEKPIREEPPEGAYYDGRMLGPCAAAGKLWSSTCKK
ncbi:hypothetical protein DFH27DRAFT_322811 [Peziza echinospora]|nr:hypothetical protein DFH27DRAFT_322811 [Peziza echinospora]